MTIDQLIIKVLEEREECQTCFNNFKNAKTSDDKQWRAYWRGRLNSAEQVIGWLNEVKAAERS